MRRWSAGLAAGFLAMCLGVLPGAVGAEEPGWQFELTPYFWAAGLSGDVGIFGAPPVSVDLRFADILENLDFAALVTFEAQRGRWGFLFDGVYLKVSDKGDTPGPVFSRVDLRNKTAALTPGLTYRVWGTAEGAVDLWLGTRIWVVDNELRFTGNLLPTRTFSDTQAWADPIVGARLRMNLAERWFVAVIGDIGGFGVASDLTWQVYGGLGYRLSERWSLKIGYRALGVDYESDGFRFDVVEHGPLVGLGFRF